MKKNILLILMIIFTLFVVTGCTNTKEDERSINYLMDEYVKAYTKADLDSVKDIFPPYYVEYAKEYMTQEYLDESLKEAQEVYGDNFTITYKITSEDKFAQNDIDALNAQIKEMFDVDDKATACYSYEGKIIYKGSKQESNESIVSMKRCKYDDKWYLVRY